MVTSSNRNKCKMEINLKPTSSKKPKWIECVSKKNSGRKYLFNTTTGESTWLSTKKEEEPQQLPVRKVLKTPANERLKRLQQKLRSDEKTKKDTNKTTTKSTQIKNDTIATTEEVKPFVSTTPLIKKTVTTPQDRLKPKELIAPHEKDDRKSPRQNAKKAQKHYFDANKQPDDEIKEKILKKESVKIGKYSKIPKSTKNISINEKVIVPPTTPKACEKKPITKECVKSINQVTERKGLILSKTLPPKTSTKIEQSTNNHFNNREDLKSIPSSSERVQSFSTADEFESTELKFLTNMPSYNSTPISNLKRSANQRLERFRQKLKKNNKNTEETHLNDQNSNIVANSTSVSNVDLDCEDMDWEPSVETTANFSFGSSAVHSDIIQDPTEMEVDDNLMLNAADKTFGASINAKWRQTHLYIVVDTNIFINQLSFIEYLKNMKPMDAGGFILYLPYCVLQELDKLKLRENIKHQVQRAIRYLNKMFETKDEHIQAQSALENRRHLIDIDNADDNILNCCLQVREHIPQVILLSEDINLRNKAMCNDINVFKKSDFLQNYLQKSRDL